MASTFFTLGGRSYESDPDWVPTLYFGESIQNIGNAVPVRHHSQHDDLLTFRQQFGRAAMTAGLAILAVPDPIPFVDEIVGAGLLFGGALMSVDRRGTIEEGESYY